VIASHSHSVSNLDNYLYYEVIVMLSITMKWIPLSKERCSILHRMSSR